MSALDDHLKDPHYANWVGNTLALEITNGVLRPYVKQEITKMHSQIVSKFPSGTTCKSCDWRQAENCKKNICNVVKKIIKDSHRFSNPSFKITNAKMWLEDSWEIAKCFLQPTRRNEDCTPADADFSAIVNIIMNDRHFDSLVSCDLDQIWNIFHKAREMRNNLMHSSVYQVGDTDSQNNLDLLINLLNDFVTHLPKKGKAIEQLNKLKTGKLQITQQNILDAHEQAKRALLEEVDRGKDEIKRCAQAEIDKLQVYSQQRRLKAKFVKGCKYSLLKLVENHIASLKPPNEAPDEWTLSRFLDKIEFIPGIAMLPDRYKHKLYPDLGKAQDVNNWDLFLLCHVLSVEKNMEPLPNNVVNYIKELKNARDRILDNAATTGKENLEELTHYLDEPLRSEVKDIFMSSGEYSDEDPLQLQNKLESWTRNDDIMDSRKVYQSYLNEKKKEAEKMEEMWKMLQQMRQEMNEMRENSEISTAAVNSAEGFNDNIGTNIELRTMHISREGRERLQNNILAEDAEENIAIAQGGISHFSTELNVENVQSVKGSILLKVTCKSLKDLILFWDSCLDGSAVRALSKMRDDYREFLGCNTLDFDIILTRKEVDRCMNQLVERLSSQLDESFREVKDKAAMFRTMTGHVAEGFSRRTGKPGLNEDRPVKTDVQPTEEETTEWSEIPKETSEDLKEEYISGDDERRISDTGKQVKTDVQRTEGETTEWSEIPKETSEDLKEKYISGDDERQISDTDKQGPSGQVTLKKGSKYSKEDATRLVKFLEEIAENFEEGKISVIKPYLVKLIKYSKDRNKKEFEEVIMDFTEATKFRSGISVTLLKQTYRGFRMILTEPEFGDLVAEKVEGIEKREELMGGVESKAWQIDPKISAEDIQVGDKIAKEPSKTSDTGYEKPDQRAGTSKGFEYHKTEEDVSSESKLSPIQGFKKDVSSSKVESFKMKSTELAMEEDKPKSMESMSFKRKPGSPGSVEATETSPAPKS